MIGYYDTVGRELSLYEWTSQFEAWDDANRHVASTKVGPFWVSTVWLGMDHRFLEEGPPVIFETCTFDHRGIRLDFKVVEPFHDLQMERYCTAQEALEGHQREVQRLRRFKPWRRVRQRPAHAWEV